MCRIKNDNSGLVFGFFEALRPFSLNLNLEGQDFMPVKISFEVRTKLRGHSVLFDKDRQMMAVHFSPDF